MKVRYAKESDIDFLIEGKEQISAIERWPDEEIKAGRDVIEGYRKGIKEKTIRVVEKDGKPVAFLYFMPGFNVMYMKKYTGRDFLWIQRIYVKESERGKGLARMLYQDAAKIAKKMGLKSLVCDVFETNAGSRKAHEKMGFRPVYSIYEKRI